MKQVFSLLMREPFHTMKTHRYDKAQARVMPPSSLPWPAEKGECVFKEKCEGFLTVQAEGTVHPYESLQVLGCPQGNGPSYYSLGGKNTLTSEGAMCGLLPHAIPETAAGSSFMGPGGHHYSLQSDQSFKG